MTVGKLIEIVSEGNTIEEAIEAGVKEANKTIKNIKQVDVNWIRAYVENGKITTYRVNSKICFVIEH